MATTRLISLCALFVALAACGTTSPRGYAQQGVVSSGDRATLNAPYYTGADPSFRPRSGGSN
jgi:hypothetical protein